MRRLVGLLAVAGLALACLVLPGVGAGAQTAAPPTIDNFQPRCVDVEGAADVLVGGQSQSTTVSVLLISPTGATVAKGSIAASSGRYNGSPFTINPGATTGNWEVRVSDRFGTVSAFIEVPCQAPTLEFDPACFPVGYSGTVTLIGRHFFAWDSPHTVTYDIGGNEQQSAIRRVSDGHGVVTLSFKVTPANRAHPGQISQTNRGLTANASWSACPPGTTTTTTSAPPDSSTTTAPPDTVPDVTTTTTARGDFPTVVPTTTPRIDVPPTIDLPPPTPGATLVVSPRIGPTGFVAQATGTGFPPGPVVLHWSPGIGSTTTIAGPDGRFTAHVLVFPKDRLGPRAIIATGGTTTAYDGFLVVQSSVQPSSGREVAQITRSRRFIQR